MFLTACGALTDTDKWNWVSAMHRHMIQVIDPELGPAEKDAFVYQMSQETWRRAKELRERGIEPPVTPAPVATAPKPVAAAENPKPAAPEPPKKTKAQLRAEARAKAAQEAEERRQKKLAEKQAAAEMRKQRLAEKQKAKAAAASPVAAKGGELDYSKWKFIQSDKGLQYRFAVARQEGNVADISVQSRVAVADQIHCTDPICDGYVLHMIYPGLGGGSIERHLRFPRSFVGPKALPDRIKAEFKTWPDGSRRYWTRDLGIVSVAHAGAPEMNDTFFYNCVDNKLADRERTRCTDYRPALAEVMN
jgi:hypothetical protein